MNDERGVYLHVNGTDRLIRLDEEEMNDLGENEDKKH